MKNLKVVFKWFIVSCLFLGLFLILYPVTRSYVKPPFWEVLHMPKYVAITVDAESIKIPEGIERISVIRDILEKKYNIKIPITWFVMYDKNFNGFELALDKWTELKKRGDEIGWHYHASSFKKDLSYDSALNETAQDLQTLFPQIKNKYNFDIESFRFGWFFIPGFKLFDTLKALGIKTDASYCDSVIGQEYYNGKIRISYDRIIKKPQEVNGIFEVPRIANNKNIEVILLHDWTLLEHNFSWHNPDLNEIVKAEVDFIDEVEKYLKFHRLFPSYCQFITIKGVKNAYSN
ncbi:MAG: hypothetical protein PHX78_01770 [bacterium]|nr:hypothetical protein [bacterium]